MRISEFIKKKLKSIFSFFILQSAIRNLLSIKYFSLAQQWILFFLSLLLISLFCFKFFYHAPNPPGKKVNEFVVELSGEVRNPGIYLFQEPPTLMLAIEKAGGLKDAAFFDMDSSPEALETGTLLAIIRESPQEIKVKLGRMEAR